VRGAPLQPVQHAGRTEAFDPAVHRLTLGEVRKELLRQSTVFAPDDVLPVPCHPDCIAMAYALKLDGQVIPLTGALGTEVLLSGVGNTITYEKMEPIKKRLFELFATNHSPESSSVSLNQLLCCLPKVQTPADVTYRNVFRVIIMQFMDAHSFDVRSVKRSCVHIVHPDLRLIPFDTFNLFYRDGKEELWRRAREPLRAGALA
jgi:7,8-dihydro-6-hydroxymethylpterin dimethyltransferase